MTVLKTVCQKLFRWSREKQSGPYENPVLVYQMGKVASSSIYQSLKPCAGIDVFQLHRMSPEHIAGVQKAAAMGRKVGTSDELGRELYEHLIRPRRPVKIISLVREPIGRNLSAYFQNLPEYENSGSVFDELSADQLILGFLEKYSHNVPLRWFDREMKEVTGIDVYEHHFPVAEGHQVIHAPPYDLLLMRHDLDDRLKEDLIKGFLGLESFQLVTHNNAAEKDYAGRYREVVSTIKVPEEYAERMLSSRYARHFFPDAERRELYRTWTGKDHPDIQGAACCD